MKEDLFKGIFCICEQNPCVGHHVEFTDTAGKSIFLKALSKEEITEAVAGAWCHPLNEHKNMDVDLANVIIDNILEAQKKEKQNEKSID
mgnify:CR=1 FL=1